MRNMSKELDELSKQFGTEKPVVIRKEISLYKTSISTASASFLREVDQQSKKLKQANIKLIAIIQQPNAT